MESTIASVTIKEKAWVALWDGQKNQPTKQNNNNKKQNKKILVPLHISYSAKKHGGSKIIKDFWIIVVLV